MTLPIISTYASISPTGDERLTDLGLDALDLVSIAIELEEQHGGVIRDSEIEAWSFVQDIVRTAERLRG